VATALKPELGKPQAACMTAALLTVEEAAALLRVPVSWVYERTRRRTKDRLPGFRLGKYWRFRESDLLEWIEEQRVGERSDA
jgi:excisionase family DNA binding protein